MELLDYILTSEIYNFDELINVIDKELPSYPIEAELLIIDSLTSLYRPNAGPISLTLLRKALSALQSIALSKKLAIVFTNQVASKMEESQDFRPVASASTRSYSDYTIRLSRLSDSRTEISFEDINGEEIEVLEPFTIANVGIEEFAQLFQIVI